MKNKILSVIILIIGIISLASCDSDKDKYEDVYYSFDDVKCSTQTLENAKNKNVILKTSSSNYIIDYRIEVTHSGVTNEVYNSKNTDYLVTSDSNIELFKTKDNEEYKIEFIVGDTFKISETLMSYEVANNVSKWRLTGTIKYVLKHNHKEDELDITTSNEAISVIDEQKFSDGIYEFSIKCMPDVIFRGDLSITRDTTKLILNEGRISEIVESNSSKVYTLTAPYTQNYVLSVTNDMDVYAYDNNGNEITKNEGYYSLKKNVTYIFEVVNNTNDSKEYDIEITVPELKDDTVVEPHTTVMYSYTPSETGVYYLDRDGKGIVNHSWSINYLEKNIIYYIELESWSETPVNFKVISPQESGTTYIKRSVDHTATYNINTDYGYYVLHDNVLTYHYDKYVYLDENDTIYTDDVDIIISEFCYRAKINDRIVYSGQTIDLPIGYEITTVNVYEYYYDEDGNIVDSEIEASINPENKLPYEVDYLSDSFQLLFNDNNNYIKIHINPISPTASIDISTDLEYVYINA
ncbi:MAG TPA: hypothetical protein O0X14_03100, partial [Methanocorpusculum sp.]|nr:hypothetical protein [Methanocorpusculum sp.]